MKTLALGGGRLYPLGAMRKRSFIIMAALLALSGGFAPKTTQAAGEGGLPVPRFVTLGVDEVNLRAGPGTRYPIRLVVRREGLPVEIIREFDVWRQVRDRDGDEGWVHKTMLSGRRNVVVQEQARTLYKKPDSESRPVARLEPGVIARLDICRDAWCRIESGGYKGWILRTQVWGVYPDEIFKE